MSKRSLSRFVSLAALAFGLGLGASAHAHAHAQVGVGVSVSINQPGMYGRIDIGNQPPPPVIYQQPVVIQPAPYSHQVRPIYMRVPDREARNWSKYCQRYGACNNRVYFVKPDWRPAPHPAAHAPHHPPKARPVPPGHAKKGHGHPGHGPKGPAKGHGGPGHRH